MSALKGTIVRQGATTWTGDEALRAYLTDVSPVDERFLTIRNHLSAFLGDVAPGELKFAYVGQAHAIDLYLSQPRLSVMFWHKPFALGTLVQSAELRQINETLKIKTPAPTIDDNSLEYFALPYLYAMESIKQLGSGTTVRPAHRAADAGFPRAVVINEIHGLVSTEWTAQMPAAACLSSAGITRVSVGLEGFADGRRFTLNDVLRRRSMLEQFEFRAKRLGLDVSALVTKIFPSDLAKKILSGQVQDNPGVTAFIRKLMDYEAAGLSIELRGLEAPDYRELGD